MCKPCAVETNDLFASVGTVNIDTLAAVASLDPGAAAPLPTPPEWTGTIDMRHLPQLPQLPPLPTPPPPSSSSIESESDSLPSPKDIPLPETPPTWNIQPTSPRVDAPDSPSPTRLCTICAKRPAKHRATTKSGQNIVLCAKCATAIRNKPLPKSASIRSGSGVSISSASNAELAAMANATAAGAATLKRVNNKVCQRCNQNQALLKANMGTRVVILCELCVADVREHRLARSAQTPTGLCQRCGAADATRVQQRSNGSTSHVCTACSAKATLVVKR